MTVKLVFDKADGTQAELDAQELLDALWFYADRGTDFVVPSGSTRRPAASTPTSPTTSRTNSSAV